MSPRLSGWQQQHRRKKAAHFAKQTNLTIARVEYHRAGRLFTCHRGLTMEEAKGHRSRQRSQIQVAGQQHTKGHEPPPEGAHAVCDGPRGGGVRASSSRAG